MAMTAHPTHVLVQYQGMRVLDIISRGHGVGRKAVTGKELWCIEEAVKKARCVC